MVDFLGCLSMCAMVKSRYIGDGHPNPYKPLLYGNNGNLDPGTCNIKCLCIGDCGFFHDQQDRNSGEKSPHRAPEKATEILCGNI